MKCAPELVAAVSQLQGASDPVEVVSIEPGQTGLQFLDGRLDATLGPGTYAMWRGVGRVKTKAEEFGIQVTGLGIRDIVLPGEMKDLLNKVTEAKKAAEANLITRREEVAAMRSQANTARIFETSPMLMRLKELEVLGKVAAKANLQVVLGEKGLADRVMKLI